MARKRDAGPDLSGPLRLATEDELAWYAEEKGNPEKAVAIFVENAIDKYVVDNGVIRARRAEDNV